MELNINDHAKGIIMKTKVKFLHKNATFNKAYPTDSGYDLTACDYEYKGTGLWHIKLGVAVEPPSGYYFEVVPRSSFSKTPFILANNIGIIDQTYRGEWLFPIRCLSYLNVESIDDTSSNRYYPKIDIESCLIGKRIAQAILRKYHNSEIEIVNELSETDRGSNGLGSTGV